MNIEHNDNLLNRLSAAYVLGTLKGGARRRFDTLLTKSFIIQREVGQWQQRLIPLAEFAPAVAPPAYVWAKVSQRLALNQRIEQSGIGFWTGLRNSLNFWRGLGLVSTTLATVMIAFVLTKAPEPANASFVAMLSDDKAQPVVMIFGDASRHQLTARIITQQAIPADKSLELWAIPKQGAPRSLGLIAKSGSITLPLPANATPQTIAMLAVSLEPLHGSPNPSGPTGPILFKESLQQI